MQIQLRHNQITNLNLMENKFDTDDMIMMGKILIGKTLPGNYSGHYSLRIH